MAVISKSDVVAAAGTKNFPFLTAIIMRLMKIDKFNVMMDEAGDLEGVDFAKFVLNFLGITIKVDPEDLKQIPLTGSFLAVANHPFGAIESLALLSLLVTARPDTLFMGNFLLKRVPNLEQYVIAVNPFDTIKDSSSITGLKTTLHKLRSGVPVAIFPAGEVSSFDFKARRITDREWHPVVGKIMERAKVPVLPVYFYGDNGIGFSLLRYIHKSLQTAMLPAELFNKKGMCLRVRIGKPIYPTESTVPQASQLLTTSRVATYALKEVTI
jgi:putative hemolysin